MNQPASTTSTNPFYVPTPHPSTSTSAFDSADPYGDYGSSLFPSSIPFPTVTQNIAGHRWRPYPPAPFRPARQPLFLPPHVPSPLIVGPTANGLTCGGSGKRGQGGGGGGGGMTIIPESEPLAARSSQQPADSQLSQPISNISQSQDRPECQSPDAQAQAGAQASAHDQESFSQSQAGTQLPLFQRLVPDTLPFAAPSMIANPQTSTPRGANGIQRPFTTAPVAVAPGRVDSYRPSLPPPAPVGRARPMTAQSIKRPSPLLSIGAGSGVGAGPRDAASVFMKEREVKVTAGDRILAFLGEMQTSFLTELAGVKDENRKLRDQVHDLLLGQKALATKEEVQEEISGQLTPALQELSTSILEGLQSLSTAIPKSTAEILEEAVSGQLGRLKEVVDSERTAREDDRKAAAPLTTLLNHLIAKLDNINTLSASLSSLKDLPTAISDVAVFKQVMDAMMPKLAHPPTVSPSRSAIPSASAPSGASEGTAQILVAIDAIQAQLNHLAQIRSGEKRDQEAPDISDLPQIMLDIKCLLESRGIGRSVSPIVPAKALKSLEDVLPALRTLLDMVTTLTSQFGDLKARLCASPVPANEAAALPIAPALASTNKGPDNPGPEMDATGDSQTHSFSDSNIAPLLPATTAPPPPAKHKPWSPADDDDFDSPPDHQGAMEGYSPEEQVEAEVEYQSLATFQVPANPRQDVFGKVQTIPPPGPSSRHNDPVSGVSTASPLGASAAPGARGSTDQVEQLLSQVSLGVTVEPATPASALPTNGPVGQADEWEQFDKKPAWMLNLPSASKSKSKKKAPSKTSSANKASKRTNSTAPQTRTPSTRTTRSSSSTSTSQPRAGSKRKATRSPSHIIPPLSGQNQDAQITSLIAAGAHDAMHHCTRRGMKDFAAALGQQTGESEEQAIVIGDTSSSGSGSGSGSAGSGGTRIPSLNLAGIGDMEATQPQTQIGNDTLQTYPPASMTEGQPIQTPFRSKTIKTYGSGGRKEWNKSALDRTYSPPLFSVLGR